MFSREEVLSGLPARRAAALLFLIESRTAFLVAQSRQAMERFLTEEAARERALAFVEAFALGRDAPLKPKVQDLERFALHWAAQVPENPRIRAALAHLFGRKYRLVAGQTTGIQAAIGFNSPEVDQAYQRLYRTPIASLFTARPPPIESLRWVASGLVSKLESLPPFWTAFSLTLTETIGAGILALPIALASIGAMGGLAILIVLGLVNVLTIMAMAEAVSRSGRVRYDNAFIGVVVSEYLGPTGSALLTIATASICFAALTAYYVGFSLTLAHATQLPRELWAVVLFVAGIFLISRDSLSSTVASALIVGAVNLTLILAISILALSHLQIENLLHIQVPFISGRPFEPSALGLVFGVAFVAYFGHLSVSNCARVVLQRDASARSLIWGTAAAQLVTIVIYCTWVLAVTGAVPPETLAAESGTTLAPLAREIGPIVLVLGTAFVVLGMGMASVHYSLGLFNLVQERLPTSGRSVVTIPRQSVTLVLHPRRRPSAHPRVTVAFVDRENGQVRLMVQVETANGSLAEEVLVADRWDSANLQRRLTGQAGQPSLLKLEVLDSWSGAARLRIVSPLSLSYQGTWESDDLTPMDLLEISESQARIVRWAIRNSAVSVSDAAEFLGWEEADARTLLKDYADLGLLAATGEGAGLRFRARLGSRRTHRVPDTIWQALSPVSATSPADVSPVRSLDNASAGAGPGGETEKAALPPHLGRLARFLLSVSPIALVFVMVEWLFFAGRENFSAPLGLVGTISVSVLAGALPVLLLASSRRRGEYIPGVVYAFLGHPLTLAGIYMFFLAALLAHGLVIWQHPVSRLAALLSAAALVALTVSAVLRRSFAPRAVVEIRQSGGPEGATDIRVTDSGRPAAAEILLTTDSDVSRPLAPDGTGPPYSALRTATFRVRDATARQLKVWVHEVTPENNSESLPAEIEFEWGGTTRRYELRAGARPIDLKLDAGEFTLTVRPRQPGRAPAARATRLP